MGFLNPRSILLFCSIYLSFGNTAKILGVFPIKAKSHFFFDFAVMKTLANAGHDVTMICPFPEVGPLNNLKIIDPRTNITSESTSRFVNPNFQKTTVLKHLQNSKKLLIQDCKDFTNSLVIQDLLSSTDINFDVMFVHMLPMYQCYLPIAKKFDIPVIGTITFRQFMSIDEAVGNPHHLTLPFTSCANPKVMTFFQRLKNTAYHLIVKAFYDFEIEAAVGEFLKQYYPSNGIDFDHSISLLFSNNHPSILAKPLAPNVIEVGGIHISRSNPLPEKLEKFITTSKHEVILFSMGSIADHEMVNKNMQQILRDTFAEIPQRIIWKFGKEIGNLTDNVYIAKWIPQLDILAHQNVKAFISHCGISGTYEAIHTATPMILFPLFGDQPSTAALLDEMEVGIHVDITTLTKEVLLKAISSVLKDEKYSRNMDHLSQVFKDRSISPQKNVIYWTEYVLRHNGTGHLDIGIKNIPLYQYLLFDIFIFIILIIIFTLYIVKWMMNNMFLKIRTIN